MSPQIPSTTRNHYILLCLVLTLILLIGHSLYATPERPHLSQAAPGSVLAASRSPLVSNYTQPGHAQTYRQRLELYSTAHSPTLTFNHIYVVSLPNRTDRRERMKRIASALGLQITFVDALNKDSPMILWIGEQVFRMRDKKRPFLAAALGLNEKDVGGMSIDSIWLARPGQRGKTMLDLPSAKEDRFGGLDWVEYMLAAVKDAGPEESGSESGGGRLLPDHPAFNVTKKLWDPLEKLPSRQMNTAVLSTWFSHMKAIRTMRANGDESGLVLEDDVDIEWDVERLWSAIYRKMPEIWEMTFLGHCWGKESTHPTGLHPSLFHSFGPRCLHAYALSRIGYTRILELMTEPYSAYQAPVDTAIPTFIKTGALSPYSLDPPLVIQSKDSPSSIQPGVGSKWRGILQDSTLERIWREEGKTVPPLTFPESAKDPYVGRPHVDGQHYHKRKQRLR